jgi:hypothetical protein
VTSIEAGPRDIALLPAERHYSAGQGSMPAPNTGGLVGAGGFAPGGVLLEAGVIDFAINSEPSPFNMPVLKATTAGSYLSLYFADEWGWGMEVTSITDPHGNTYTEDVTGSWYGTQVWRGLLHTPVVPGDSLTVSYTPHYGEPSWGTGCVVGATFSKMGNLRASVIGDGYEHLDFDLQIQAGDLVVGYGGFYHATDLTLASAPWINFVKDMTVPDSQVVGDWLHANIAMDLFYNPAATANGGSDEGVILAYRA